MCQASPRGPGRPPGVQGRALVYPVGHPSGQTKGWGRGLQGGRLENHLQNQPLGANCTCEDGAAGYAPPTPGLVLAEGRGVGEMTPRLPC